MECCCKLYRHIKPITDFTTAEMVSGTIVAKAQ
jgi:hypothetical protein